MSSPIKILFKKAIKEIEVFKTDKEVEHLHKLRIQLKRVDALLRILKFIKKDFPVKKHRKAYKKIFEDAGQIWGAFQLQLAAGKSPDDKSFLKKFGKVELKMEENSMEFIHNADAFIELLRKEMKKLRAGSDLLTASRLEDYIRTELQGLEHREEPGNFVEMHKFRKKIKRILYANDFLADIESAPLFSKVDAQKLDDLQNTVGMWHDDVVLYEIEKGDKKDKREMMELKKSLEERMNEMYTTINKTIIQLESRLGTKQ